MGTIRERKRRDGSIAFLAEISIMRDRKVVHRESETFARRAMAAKWIKTREAILYKPGGLEAARTAAAQAATLGDAIRRYRAESARTIGRTKAQVLRTLEGMPIADLPCGEIRSADLVALAHELGEGRTPATVGNYLSHLAAVFAIAQDAWGYPLDDAAMRSALRVTRRLGTVGRSRQRDRRPSLDELERLLEHFAAVRRRRPDSCPMVDVTLFALFSTRRQEEITRLAWADLDGDGARILVRDMKHPGQKIGNDQWCTLPDEALRILLAQPRTGPLAFPWSTDAISAAFTRACKLLAIEDLHFHDLRHEGISRLFEMGWNVPRVAAVSGHRSWQSLARYTHLRQTGDRYQGWGWSQVQAA